MSTLTIRCGCGLYVRAVDVTTHHVLDMTRAWIAYHSCETATEGV